MIVILVIFLPEHNNFIEDNEEFKLGGEDLEKFNNFSKILNSKFYKLLFSKFLPLFSTLEVLKVWDLIY